MERASEAQIFMWDTFDYTNYISGSPVVDNNGLLLLEQEDLAKIGSEVETQNDMAGIDAKNIAMKNQNPKNSQWNFGTWQSIFGEHKEKSEVE